MKSLNFTFVTEGSSDEALIPHLRWLLQQNGVETPIESLPGRICVIYPKVMKEEVCQKRFH